MLAGVTVLASITETLIQGARLRDAPWFLTLAWILAWAMLVTATVSQRRPIRSAVLMLLIVLAAAIASPMLHIFGNIVVPSGLVFGSLIVIALHTAVNSHLHTSRELIRTLSNAKAELEIKVDERTKELRDTQAHLVQSEKMASLGNVAANVAHLINNPIGAVTSAADTAQRCITKIDAALEEDTPDPKLAKPMAVLKQSTQLIVDSAGTVAKFVRSLREFTGHDMADVRTVDLNEAMDHTITLMAHELAGIEIHRDYGTLPPVTCYASELNQAFLNVFHNGARAIDKTGTIAVKTSANGGNVHIEIKDSGVGINKDDMDRIFDLGFSGWGGGESGHGLAAARDIMEKHNGKILVESERDVGSTFTFVIPTNLATSDDTQNGGTS
jgi:two-component system NtrC family sensor kinase